MTSIREHARSNNYGKFFNRQSHIKWVNFGKNIFFWTNYTELVNKNAWNGDTYILQANKTSFICIFSISDTWDQVIAYLKSLLSGQILIFFSSNSSYNWSFKRKICLQILQCKHKKYCTHKSALIASQMFASIFQLDLNFGKYFTKNWCVRKN